MTVVSVRPGDETPVGVRRAGPVGPAPKLTVGTVESGEEPSFELVPDGPGAYKVNVVLQQGKEGPPGDDSTVPGPANTLTVNSVTAGETFTFKISGSSPNQKVDVTYHQPDDGADGISIASAVVNEAGHLILTFSDETEQDAGKVVGENGPANTLTIGTVTKGETASASISGSAPEQELNLTLPQGEAGPAPIFTIGTVTTVAPGSPATVTINAVAPGEYELDFSLPQGASGAGTGDMLASVYDTDSDGKVNSAVAADQVPWSGVQDKPEFGDLATKDTIDNADWSGDDLAIENGGTGSSTASGARTNLGLAIGTNVQAYSAKLAAIAALTWANRKGIRLTGTGTVATYDLSDFILTLLDDADAAAALATLGAQAAAAKASAAEIRTGTNDAKHMTPKGHADAAALGAASTGSGTWSCDLTGSRRRIFNGTSVVGAPTNAVEGFTYELSLKQDATGGRAISFHTCFDFMDSGTPAPSTGANKEDILVATCLSTSPLRFMSTFVKAAA